jgi:hypothetical protein
MTWQQRLCALVLAGGAVVAGCGNDTLPQGSDLSGTEPVQDLSGFFGTCNANPDPCCQHPTAPGCPSDGGTHD